MTANRPASPRHASTVAGLSALVLACAATVAGGPQGPADDWRLDGAVTVDVGYYDIAGDRSASPFAFDDLHSYGQLVFDFEKPLGPYRVLRAHFLGIGNDSEYRSPDHDLVIERLRISFDDGSAALPYRLELGDSYVYFSQRTVQRPLKGLRFELQSTLGAPDRFQSLQFVGGLYDTNWRGLELRDDQTMGISWLVQDPILGAWSVNYLDAMVDDERLLGDPRRDQRLMSVAGYVPFTAAGMSLVLEGEAAYLRDRLELDGSEKPDQIEDQGYFAQLFGRAGRANYRLRFEQYGDGYEPFGAPIVANRQIAEGHVGFRLTSGGEIRGRWHQVREDHESADPLERQTYGVRYSGPLASGWMRDLNAALDLFLQDRASRSLGEDDRTVTFDGQLRRGSGDWAPLLRLFYRDIDDQTSFDLDEKVLDVGLTVARRLAFAGLSGTVEPGVSLRRIRDGVSSSDDWEPTLALNLSRGAHSFVQQVGYLTQDRRLDAGLDVDTLSYRGLYRYGWRDHTFQLQYERFDRAASPGEDTDTYRVAAAWTYNFRLRPRGAAAARTGIGQPAPASGFELADLAIGSPVDQAVTDLRKAGHGSPNRVGQMQVFFTSVLDRVHQAQRVVLLSDEAGNLVRTSLLIVPEETADAARFEQEFERVRQVLVARYGPPDSIYDEGALGSDVAAALNADAFVRSAEWDRAGRRIRFGIPRRVDGQLLFELAIAASFPGVRDTLWSIDDARR